jgi:hypothetical protein
MEIYEGIEIMDLALRCEDSLIIADVHIGYEEALNKQGILVPRFQFREVVQRVERICREVSFDTIIINGDLKHEFGTISEQEWRDTLKFLDLFRNKKIVLIKGNHDTILGPIAQKRNVEVRDFLMLGKVFICHGDKIPSNPEFRSAKVVVIGHEHPALSIKEGARVELFKCFLKGKYRGKILIVQPSFNLVTEGTDVITEKLLSPFLQQDLSEFEAYVVADRVYRFGKVRNLVL